MFNRVKVVVSCEIIQRMVPRLSSYIRFPEGIDRLDAAATLKYHCIFRYGVVQKLYHAFSEIIDVLSSRVTHFARDNYCRL